MGLTIDQIVYGIRQSAGNLTAAARGLGVTRQALYKRVEASATLQAVLQDEREALVDMAESALRKNVLEGDTQSILHVLKASPAAKARGWGEKQEISGPNNGPVEQTVTHRIDADTAGNIFDILAAAGALSPAPGHAETE